MFKRHSVDSSTPETVASSATQRVFNRLRHKIISAQIPPGQRLKIDELKSELQTGASPIREALSLLTSDQLVERLDQRGFRAAPASEANFHEILRLRCELDSIALRDSIRLAGADWEERLVLSQHRLCRACRDDIHAWEAHHKAFHLALLQACESPILLRFCEQLYDLNIRYRYLIGQTTGYDDRDIASEHQEIFEAALDRDADRAVAKLVDHYTRTTGTVSNALVRV